jgi:tetratricopeptide (TPR) repeat protein
MNDSDDEFEQALKFSDGKNYLDALRLYSDLIEKYPTDPKGYRKRSHLYAKMELWEEAAQDIGHALSFGPKEPCDFFTRGRMYLRMNKAKQAYEDLTKTIELGNCYDDHYYTEMAHFFRAECLLRLGRLSEALADCEHVREDMKTFIYPSVRSKADIVREARYRLPPDR